MRAATSLALLALAVLPLPGCIVAAAAAAGAAAYGVVSYDKNESWMDFHQDLDRVYQVAQDAVRGQGYTVLEAKKLSAIEATVDAEGMFVRIEKFPDGFIRAKARAGTFETEDNKRKARLLLEDMRDRIAK